MNKAELLLLLGSVFILSFGGTRWVRRLARRHGWLAMPRQDRWHPRPTASWGGVGFYPPFAAGVLWILIRRFGIPFPPWNAGGAPPAEALPAFVLLAASLLMFVCGLLDDVFHFRPAAKLAGQLIAAGPVLFVGETFQLTGNRFLDLTLSCFWFVGIINAMNMLDNMDGLCAGVGIIAALNLGWLSCHGGAAAWAAPLAWVLAAALAGFWFHNRAPASIFMGDSGSLFAGLVLAALAIPAPSNDFLGLRQNREGWSPLLLLVAPATVLAVPIFDTTLVTVTRLWRGRRPTQGGRDHASHRLVLLGWSEKSAVRGLYLMAAVGGGLAALIQHWPSGVLPIVSIFVFSLIMAGVYLGRVKVPSQGAALET